MLDQITFDQTIALLDAHGARGFGVGDPSTISEVDRFQVSKTVYLCLPAGLVHVRRGEKFGPLIQAHLSSVGIGYTPLAIEVLVGVCKQLTASSSLLAGRLGRRVRRKYGLADVRAAGAYQKLLSRQGARCATCGVSIDAAHVVELDHWVPFSLVGDVTDGSNWRVLCGPCNLGKHHYLSSLQLPDAWNWLRADELPGGADIPSRRARYATLAAVGRCDVPHCGRGPLDEQLWVVLQHPHGLPVRNNLGVRCGSHVSGTPIDYPIVAGAS